MSNYFKDATKKLEIFFKGNIKTNKDIFLALQNIFHIDNCGIYFVTPDCLRLEYAFQENSYDKTIELDCENHQNIFTQNCELNLKIFDSQNSIIAERLLIHNTVFGIILIDRTQKFNDNEIEFFKTCSMIISSIIKELELTKVLKLQTEELQKGIVETVKANAIIKSQNKKIIATDKIKTEFLSHVSHELRTPLNSIIGFSELLQNPKLGKLNDKQLDFVKDIQTSGISLLGMINEILDISKLESGTMKLNLRDFDIKICVEETLNILNPLLNKKNITITDNVENTVITADYQKIQQVLFNILNNAIKFSPEDDFIEIKTKRTKKYIEISIKDNGCGIAQKNHKKIFKKFIQIQSTNNSTGLGLAISKELVNLHMGKIKVTSELNKGAEFTIKLPLSYV